MQEMQEIRVKGKATRIRGATWTHDQVKKLFEVWTQPDIYHGLLNEKKKLDIFKRMAEMLAPLGVQRTWSECRAKIKNLKADFRRAMEKNIEFRYYLEMRKIMNLDGSSTSTIKPSTSTSSRIESFQHDDQPDAPDSDGDDDTDGGLLQFGYSPASKSETSMSPTRLETSVTSVTSSIEQPTTPTSEYITASPHHLKSQPNSPYTHQQFQMEYELGRQVEMQRSVGQTVEEVDQDSSSRSSMIITHVVSNVIEPVTTVIMPSTSKNMEFVPGSVDDQLPPTTPTPISHALEERPPIRLEFVVDESENIVFQESTSSTDQAEQIQQSIQDTFTPTVATATPHTATPSPILKKRLSQSVPVSPAKLTSRPAQPERPRPSPSKQRIIPPPKKRKIPATTPPDQFTEKKRKQLENLNKRTVETISNLLTDSSQCLLRELQEAEQRFILWEEEKRNEERKREEAMFEKLIGAMSNSTLPVTPLSRSSNENQDISDNVEKDKGNFLKDITDMSRKLNGMLTDEVKATEESVRQWELKMQRQESKHTEKLFAMIINAIKSPAEV